MGAKIRRYGTLAALLWFAATAQFCFLNPQPEPPAGDRGTSCPACTTGGKADAAGGTTGGGGAGGSGGIDPSFDAARDGVIIVGDASLPPSSDAQTDAGSTDDADGATDDADGATDGSPDDVLPPDDAHDAGAPDAPPLDAPDAAIPDATVPDATPSDAASDGGPSEDASMDGHRAR